MASAFIGWMSIFFAPVMIVFGLYVLYKSGNPRLGGGSIVLIGVALLVFDAMRPTDVEFSWSRVALKTGVPEPKALAAVNAADIQPFVAKTNKAIDLINQALADQDKKINYLTAAVPKGLTQPALKPIQSSPIPPIVVSPIPSKTILVFYRNNEKLADQIVSALRSNGFKSAASNSSLDEIRQWVDASQRDDINICANGDGEDLLKQVKDVILAAVPSAGGKIFTENGWSFRASDAQIFIF